MLARITATEFIRPMKTGKTTPSLLVCERPDGTEVEVVAKYSSCCYEKETNLAMEVIGACLAADLGLPVPEPFIVELSEDFIASVTDKEHQAKMRTSNSVCFGSALILHFHVWISGDFISESMLPNAAAIFGFDGIVQNPDRGDERPNLMVRGDEFRLIDHEMAFSHRLPMFIPWKAPWQVGGLQAFEPPGRHIFRSGLKGRLPDCTSIRSAWVALPDATISGYANAIPSEWASATNSVASALQLIKDARDNIDACIAEIKRVLR